SLSPQVRDGEVELDDSAFGRAIMNSTVASRLSEELRRLDANPIPCLQSAKLIKSSPATLRAKIVCPTGTPYEGCTLTMELVASDGYPFMPPVAKFLNRVFHLNFSVLLDGTTAVRSVLHQWTAEWNVAKFLREVIRLLRDPDPSLLPDSISRGASKAAAAVERLSAPSNASRRSPKVQQNSQGGGFGKVEEKDQGSDKRHYEGTGRDWRERDGGAGVNEGRCHRSSIVEGRHPALPPDGEVRGGVGGVGPQGAFGSVTSPDTTTITGDNRGGRRAGEGVLPEHEMSSPNREGRENERHVRGDDLRETKWGDLMSVRVASLWFDNRPLYEQTARRIAATQAEGNRSSQIG
ncbi:unnamed protein product, partial [Ectocarpus sp. 13 AM-2016]